MTASTGVARGQAVTEGSHGDKATGTRPRAGRRGHLGTRGHLRTRGQRAGRRGGGHGDTREHLAGTWGHPEGTLGSGTPGTGTLRILGLPRGSWGAPKGARGIPRGVPKPCSDLGRGHPQALGVTHGCWGCPGAPKVANCPQRHQQCPQTPQKSCADVTPSPPFGVGAPTGDGEHPQV